MLKFYTCTILFQTTVGIKNGALGNSFSGITHVPSFLKIRQLGQRLKWLDTHTNTHTVVMF